MKHSAGNEPLQETFRQIGRTLLRAESVYFWFGFFGRSAEETSDLKSACDYLKQELVGIRTADLELYLEDLSGSEQDEEEIENQQMLGLEATAELEKLSLFSRILRCFCSEKRRRASFAHGLHREIRRRYGESDDGNTPVPAGYPLRVSFKS